VEVTLVTLGGSDTLAFTQQFIPGHSAHTIQFALIIILGVLIGPMCAHIGGTHECGEVQSHALVASWLDSDGPRIAKISEAVSRFFRNTFFWEQVEADNIF